MLKLKEETVETLIKSAAGLGVSKRGLVTTYTAQFHKSSRVERLEIDVGMSDIVTGRLYVDGSSVDLDRNTATHGAYLIRRRREHLAENYTDEIVLGLLNRS